MFKSYVKLPEGNAPSVMLNMIYNYWWTSLTFPETSIPMAQLPLRLAFCPLFFDVNFDLRPKVHQVGGIRKHLCQGSGRFLHTEGQAADVELLEESLARWF